MIAKIKSMRLLTFSLVMFGVAIALIAANRLNPTHSSNKAKVRNVYTWGGPITFRTYKNGAGSETAIASGTKYGTLYDATNSFLKTDMFRPNSGKFTVQWLFYGDTINASIQCRTAVLGDSGVTTVNESRYQTAYWNGEAIAASTTADSIYDLSASARYLFSRTCTYDIGHADAFYFYIAPNVATGGSVVLRGDLALKEYY